MKIELSRAFSLPFVKVSSSNSATTMAATLASLIFSSFLLFLVVSSPLLFCGKSRFFSLIRQQEFSLANKKTTRVLHSFLIIMDLWFFRERGLQILVDLYITVHQILKYQSIFEDIILVRGYEGVLSLLVIIWFLYILYFFLLALKCKFSLVLGYL